MFEKCAAAGASSARTDARGSRRSPLRCSTFTIQRRLGATVVAGLMVFGLLTPVGASAQNAAPPPWTTKTVVTGGWQGTPPVVPTMVEPTSSTLSMVGQYTLHGTWTGVVYFSSEDVRIDRTTGDYTFHSKATFAGSWVEDGSTGTVTWLESVSGNVITGETRATLEITGGSGDPPFQCSSGTLMWIGYANPVTSFGGYTGTWEHGCRHGSGTHGR